RAGAAGAVENDEYLAALGRNLHPETGTAGIPVDGVRLRGRQRVDDSLGQPDARHGRQPCRAVLPSLHIGSTANEMTGATVIRGRHRRKKNQRVMNRRQSTSISGKRHPKNARGEGKEPAAGAADLGTAWAKGAAR